MAERTPPDSHQQRRAAVQRSLALAFPTLDNANHIPSFTPENCALGEFGPDGLGMFEFSLEGRLDGYEG